MGSTKNRQIGDRIHRYIDFRSIIISIVFWFVTNFFSLAASENIRVGIFDFDPLCRISAPNKAGGLFVDLLQYIAVKEGWRIHYRAGTLTECMERLEKGEIDLVPAAAYSGKSEERFYFTRETVISKRDGSERIILSTCAPILDRDRQIIGAVLVFHDITGKRIMELEIQKALKLESLGILAAGIAHDFNNLLAIIMGNIGLAKRFIDREDRAYKILDDAEKGAYSATGLSQQLLTFARGNAPVMPRS